MQERINATPFAKDHLLCLLRSRTPGMQARLATSLAHLLEPDDIARAYGPYGGAAVLLEHACDPDLAVSDPEAWARSLEALQRVVKSCKERQDKNSTSFVPAPPEEKVRPRSAGVALKYHQPYVACSELEIQVHASRNPGMMISLRVMVCHSICVCVCVCQAGIHPVPAAECSMA